MRPRRFASFDGLEPSSFVRLAALEPRHLERRAGFLTADQVVAALRPFGPSVAAPPILGPEHIERPDVIIPSFDRTITPRDLQGLFEIAVGRRPGKDTVTMPNEVVHEPPPQTRRLIELPDGDGDIAWVDQDDDGRAFLGIGGNAGDPHQIRVVALSPELASALGAMLTTWAAAQVKGRAGR